MPYQEILRGNKTVSIESYNLLIVLGPTASGKTSLAVKLANKLQGEIISADSRQVYRGMDIGSGKDLEEYGDIPYHLIDIVSPGHEFNLFEFQKHFVDAYSDIKGRHKLPMLVGGTGMYLDSILSGYKLVEAPVNTSLREQLSTMDMNALAERLQTHNPNLHNTTDLLERERLIRAIEIAEAEKQTEATCTILPKITPLVLGIRWERDTLKQRIRTRLKQRLEQGMIEEVDHLHTQGVSWETLHFYGLEYRFVAAFLQHQLNRNDMYQKLYSAICTFAKQQEKWFKRMERKGICIHWLDGSKDIYQQAVDFLQNH